MLYDYDYQVRVDTVSARATIGHNERYDAGSCDFSIRLMRFNLELW